MSVYLIDYENVGMNGLSGLEYLESTDKFIIFFGNNAASLSFDKHVQLACCQADIEYIRCDRCAKNYLDFQLATYFGYLIANTHQKNLFIISNDKGFDSIIDFWSQKKPELEIKRISSIEEVYSEPSPPFPVISMLDEKRETIPAIKNKLPKELQKRIKQKLKEEHLSGSDYSKIYHFFLNDKNQKQFLSSFEREFKTNSSRLYKKLLPEFEFYQQAE